MEKGKALACALCRRSACRPAARGALDFYASLGLPHCSQFADLKTTKPSV
jgi:hypothetical protein